MLGRAGRRADVERIKARVRRRFRQTWGDRGRSMACDPRFVGRVAATPHPCSCPMGCGNRRPVDGATRRERMVEDLLSC
jgi:hypothetical protein